MSKVKNKNIIITGATSGIGEKISRYIASLGGNPIIVARSEQKLLKLQKELQATNNVKCQYYVVDLTDSHKWQAVLGEITADIYPIDAIINNAGFGIFNYVTETKKQDIYRMFQLNVFALMDGVSSVLPVMIDQGHGHIVNIASQAGKIATPKSAVYGATKHAVIGFSNALRLELEEKGIYVTTVNLGPVRTNFFTVADPNGSYQKSIDRFMLDTDIVARRVVHALFKKRREINMPRWMDIGSRIYQLFPTITEKILKSQFSKK